MTDPRCVLKVCVLDIYLTFPLPCAQPLHYVRTRLRFRYGLPMRLKIHTGTVWWYRWPGRAFCVDSVQIVVSLVCSAWPRVQVGDTCVDVEEGKNAGAWTAAVLTGEY